MMAQRGRCGNSLCVRAFVVVTRPMSKPLLRRDVARRHQSKGWHPPALFLWGQRMSTIPASIRYRNPGASYPGPSSKPFGGTTHAIIGGGHKIAIFPTMVDGASSMMHLLHRVYVGLTIGQAIAKWSGANHTNDYLRVIEARTRWTRHDYVTKGLLEDAELAIELCKAMAWHEAGREYPMTDAQWREAHEQFMTVIGGGKVALDRASPLPVTAALELAKTYIGEKRIPGPGTNPFIEDLFKEIGSTLRGDDHSYCAAGLGATLKRSGFAYIEGEAGQLARNYLKYGHALDEPEEGCLVIFWRVKPNSWQGHVAFVESWTATTLTIVGFNQGGAVSRMTVPRTGSKSQVLGYRRPVPAIRPATEVVKDEGVSRDAVSAFGLVSYLLYQFGGWISRALSWLGEAVGVLPRAADTASSAVSVGQSLFQSAGVPWPVSLGLFIALCAILFSLADRWRQRRRNDGSLTRPPYETDEPLPEGEVADMFDAPLPPARPRRKPAKSPAKKSRAAKKPAAKKAPAKRRKTA